jgi:hypothetical protein
MPDASADDDASASAKPIGQLTSLIAFPCGSAFGLALLRPPVAVGAVVRVAPGFLAGGGGVGVVSPVACATRAGAQAGGGRGEPAGGAAEDKAKKAAEAERKAAKLAAMAAKMKELGLA